MGGINGTGVSRFQHAFREQIVYISLKVCGQAVGSVTGEELGQGPDDGHAGTGGPPEGVGGQPTKEPDFSCQGPEQGRPQGDTCYPRLTDPSQV